MPSPKDNFLAIAKVQAIYSAIALIDPQPEGLILR
jgi:hypothetical protein